MGGPIVRFGPTPEYWSNWDSVFGKGKKAAAKGEQKESATLVAGPSNKKSAKKKPTPSKKAPPVASKQARKAVKKTAKKKTKK